MQCLVQFHLIVFLVASSLGYKNDLHPLSDDFINRINNHTKTWKAGRNFAKNVPLSHLKNLMGARPSNSFHKVLPVYKYNLTGVHFPESFDARDHWRNCPTIQEIGDQGSCGSCWAIAAVNAMSDRICIHSKNQTIVRLSIEDLLTCCTFCGHGCIGGSAAGAWYHWVKKGIVSGGSYGSHQGCVTYTIPPCEHNVKGLRPACESKSTTPKCTQECDIGYKSDYYADKHFGKKAYSVSSNVEQIQMEIMTNGPVQNVFRVYEDFWSYKSGVYSYQRLMGRYVGQHSVRILGWGVQNGIPYWTAANSWNNDWGHRGTFRFIRGGNHLGFESNIVAGLPKL